jgi:hypothetical protein
MNPFFKFESALRFFMAIIFLAFALMWLEMALNNNSQESHLLVANWGAPLIFLTVILFGLGWLTMNYLENMVWHKSRNTAIFLFLGSAAVFPLVGLVSLVLFPIGFPRYAGYAVSFMAMSGFFLRSSVFRPETLAKMRLRKPTHGDL